MSAQPQKPKPGMAAVILLPLAVWVVTGVIGGILIVTGIARIPDAVGDLDRAPVGTPTELDLEAGDYRVFLEGQGINDAFLTPPALLGVTGPDGEPLPVDLYDGSTTLTYDFGSNEGRAAWTFTAPTSGTYTVNVSSEEPAVEGIALGTQNPLTAGGTTILIGAVVGAVGFVLAVILLVVMVVRRGRSKKRIFQAGAGAGYGAGSFPPPGSYPPPGGYPPPGPA